MTAPWQPSSYPKELKHLGDHIRKRRLDLQLSQHEVARQLGVATRTVKHWELGEFEPTVSNLPGVIRFLGYDPRPEPESWPEWLRWYRQTGGLPQVDLARQLGVSQRVLCSWEVGKSRPSDKNLKELAALRWTQRHTWLK